MRDNLKKVIDGLGGCIDYFDGKVTGVMFNEWLEESRKAIVLLKAQEPVKPILKNGWYWCGGIGCRNSLTSVIDDNAPARKPSYCERCGRAVKWE